MKLGPTYVLLAVAIVLSIFQLVPFWVGIIAVLTLLAFAIKCFRNEIELQTLIYNAALGFLKDGELEQNVLISAVKVYMVELDREKPHDKLIALYFQHGRQDDYIRSVLLSAVRYEHLTETVVGSNTFISRK